MKRVLTALLLIPVVVGLIFYAPPLATRIALAFVGLACLKEALALAGSTLGLPAYAAGVLLVLLPTLPEPAFLAALTLALMLLAMRAPQPLAAAASTIWAVLYTCGPMAAARELHSLSPHWLFAPLIVNWAGDIAAFYCGRAFGRRKLAPKISPGKTWEGAVASLVAGTAVGAGYLVYFNVSGVTPVFAIGLGVVANVTGQAGDLAESALKRGAGVKDSGSLLPGHGGMLDRMDGSLFSFVAVYLYLFVGSF